MSSKKRLRSQREEKCKVCRDRKRKYKLGKEKYMEPNFEDFKFKSS